MATSRKNHHGRGYPWLSLGPDLVRDPRAVPDRHRRAHRRNDAGKGEGAKHVRGNDSRPRPIADPPRRRAGCAGRVRARPALSAQRPESDPLLSATRGHGHFRTRMTRTVPRCRVPCPCSGPPVPCPVRRITTDGRKLPCSGRLVRGPSLGQHNPSGGVSRGHSVASFDGCCPDDPGTEGDDHGTPDAKVKAARDGRGCETLRRARHRMYVFLHRP
jgi:hypothetical protein